MKTLLFLAVCVLFFIATTKGQVGVCTASTNITMDSKELHTTQNVPMPAYLD